MTTPTYEQLAAREQFLTAPQPFLTPPPEEEEEEKSNLGKWALGISAAWFAYRWIIKPRMTSRQEMDEQEAAHRPILIRALTPYLVSAYRSSAPSMPLGSVQTLAIGHAAGLAAYLHTTSGKTVENGYIAQLNAGIAPEIAWQRSIEGYGLNDRSMSGYISRSIGAGRTQRYDPTVVPDQEAVAINDAVLKRADLVGQEEAFSAIQLGHQARWMYEAALGLRSPLSRKKWNTARDERVCEICGPMDGQVVDLSSYFNTPMGKLYVPGAHIGCRCQIEVIDPEEVSKAVSGDPFDRNPKGQFAAKESRKLKAKFPQRPVTYAERPQPQTVADVLAPTTVPVSEPVAEDEFELYEEDDFDLAEEDDFGFGDEFGLNEKSEFDLSNEDEDEFGFASDYGLVSPDTKFELAEKGLLIITPVIRRYLHGPIVVYQENEAPPANWEGGNPVVIDARKYGFLIPEGGDPTLKVHYGYEPGDEVDMDLVNNSSNLGRASMPGYVSSAKHGDAESAYLEDYDRWGLSNVYGAALDASELIAIDPSFYLDAPEWSFMQEADVINETLAESVDVDEVVERAANAKLIEPWEAEEFDQMGRDDKMKFVSGHLSGGSTKAAAWREFVWKESDNEFKENFASISEEVARQATEVPQGDPPVMFRSLSGFNGTFESRETGRVGVEGKYIVTDVTTVPVPEAVFDKWQQNGYVAPNISRDDFMMTVVDIEPIDRPDLAT